MTHPPTLSDVIDDVQKSRAHFVDVQQKFLVSLPFTGTTEVAEHLLSHAEEFGVDRTLAVANEMPQAFSLTQPMSSTSAGLLHELLDASASLDISVRLREEMLIAQDPGHARRYSIQGQEFILDFKGQKLVFVDSTQTAPLDAQLCSLEEKAPARNRRRDRAR